jgi:hypothetical protein
MTENPLLNKVLTNILISQDRLALKFVTEGEEIVAQCDADCCSYTWIEHVETCSLPATVTAVEDIELPEQGADGKQGGVNGPSSTDAVAFYGLRITTDKGYIIIDYRNDSNGYYGGSLVWPGEFHYGGVRDQAKSGYVWKGL